MKFWKLPLLLGGLLVAISLAGCSLLDSDTDPALVTATPPLPTPANTPDISDVATPGPGPTPAAPEAFDFTVWTVPDIAPRTEVPGGSILLEQFNAFNQSHPDLNLLVELKAASGQGGMLNYLRTARAVAPGVIPDVILIPSNQLPVAIAENLVVPLDEGALDPELLEGLFPAARSLVSSGERLYGYPLVLSNLGHIAYNDTVITETMPLEWDEFIVLENGRFVFPAAGPAGAELALQFYLANGGTLSDAAGQPQLEVEPLTQALAEIQAAVTNGFVDPDSGEIRTVAEAWQLFQGGAPTIVQTDAEQFLGQQSSAVGTAFAPVPGVTGSFSPVVNAWALAVTTPDPARQALALELINWLGSPTNVGEWSYASGRVPAHRAAFDVWPTDNAYVQFLRQQGGRAQAFPAEATNTILSAISNAVATVVAQERSPVEAAELAAEAVRP